MIVRISFFDLYVLHSYFSLQAHLCLLQHHSGVNFLFGNSKIILHNQIIVIQYNFS